jgi:hypothetical protein
VGLGDLSDRGAVLTAIDEFDRLGRQPFLSKYRFGPARTYFLQHQGRLYDSKAIAGVAHGIQFPDQGPLTAAAFSGGETTVARKLEQLGFVVVASGLVATSTLLEPGAIYTRKDLAERFQITDSTLNTGIFQPRGHRSVWLFVTEQKTPDRTQYVDRLDGEVLYWQGQPRGSKDSLIIEHKQRGLELVVFYRRSRYEFPGAGFRYEGPFRYESHEGRGPTSFVLRRVASTDTAGVARATPDPDDGALEDLLLERIGRLRRWARDGEAAPHKPLLLLLALERLRQGLPRLAPFTEIEPPLRELLNQFGRQPDHGHPEYPFWRLQADDLWEIPDAAALPTRASNSDPPVSALRQRNPYGGLPLEVFDLLRSRRDVLDRVADAVLQHLEPAQRATVMAYVGWEDVGSRVLTAGPPPDGTAIGIPYREEDEQVQVAAPAPFEVDPDKIGRGLRSHRALQNQLAELLRDHGLDPQRPRPGGPAYDLAWETKAAIFVAEVKSITITNEERQLRLGLGQVLRYHDLLQPADKPVIPMLAVNREPSDPTWQRLCDNVKVRLVWPEVMAERLLSDPRSLSDPR